MKHYQPEYFKEDIFSTDYQFLAETIYSAYRPASIIEFGCGPGHLAKEFAKLNVSVTAIDGFSDPDFKDYPGISFLKVDLDNYPQLNGILSDQKFDLAVCTEVAEHLMPSSSDHLIKTLTQSAPVVIFSAAVPYQNGHGHINCQNRVFWHKLFNKCGFQISDSLREHLQKNDDLAIWYKLNVIDYQINSEKDTNKIIENLVASESYSSSLYYKTGKENRINKAYLQYPLVRNYFNLRNFIKSLLKKND